MKSTIYCPVGCNEPLFPHEGHEGEAVCLECERVFKITERKDQPLASDMTLRDYFAGQVLLGSFNEEGEIIDKVGFCEDTYRLADAMLESRK